MIKFLLCSIISESDDDSTGEREDGGDGDGDADISYVQDTSFLKVNIHHRKCHVFMKKILKIHNIVN